MKGLSTQAFPENSAVMEVGGMLVLSPPLGSDFEEESENSSTAFSAPAVR